MESPMKTKVPTYTTITKTNGDKVTGVEIERQDHTAKDVAAVLLSGGLRALWDPTPDTVVVETPDGKLYKGPQSK
jgi:hypothetical protein